MDKYNIQPHNCYNMDEKGFLIGHLQKVKRIFPKALMKKQKLLGAGQDGSREWITLLATICADGSSLPPALIYKAVQVENQASGVRLARGRTCRNLSAIARELRTSPVSAIGNYRIVALGPPVFCRLLPTQIRAIKRVWSTLVTSQATSMQYQREWGAC
jgi:hypothetical protein